VNLKASDFDHPIIFLLTISLGVAAVWALISWILISVGATGPLGLFKGGVIQIGNGGSVT
jgi:hypothetical protein